MIASERDFSLIFHFNKMADGTIYVLTFDAEKPDLVSI
jgi:hypothetical protein